MNYIFWIVIVPLSVWLMAWIVIDFMITENKGHLEDVIHAKWGKDNDN